jgi:hypothetical protein
MDQTTSSNKSFLWDIGKCGQDSNLDCNVCVCSGSQNKETVKIRLEFLYNLQIFSITLFEKMPILQALTETYYKNKITSGHIQLNLFES